MRIIRATSSMALGYLKGALVAPPGLSLREFEDLVAGLITSPNLYVLIKFEVIKDQREPSVLGFLVALGSGELVQVLQAQSVDSVMTDNLKSWAETAGAKRIIIRLPANVAQPPLPLMFSKESVVWETRLDGLDDQVLYSDEAEEVAA